MATLLKALNNLADIKSAGGVALRVRTQDGLVGGVILGHVFREAPAGSRAWLALELDHGEAVAHSPIRCRLSTFLTSPPRSIARPLIEAGPDHLGSEHALRRPSAS